MHATFAYLNAAGRRATRLTPSNGGFLRVMDTLLAGLAASKAHDPERKHRHVRFVRPAKSANAPGTGIARCRARSRQPTAQRATMPRLA